MSDEKKKENWLWPNVSTLKGARAAAMGGAAVAGFVAVVTLGFSLYAIYQQPVLNITPWSLVDVVLFVAIGIGIWRLSRMAAVAGLGLYLLEQGYQFATVGPKAPVLVLFFTLALINAVRGTFSYHRLAAVSPQDGVQDNGGQQREQP